MPEQPFPLDELRTVVRWVVEWALAQPPGEAASGSLEIEIRDTPAEPEQE